MIKVQVTMKFTGEPFKRVTVRIIPDADPQHPLQALTDRSGVALFNDATPMPGKIMVDGIARHQGYLEGEINIELRSLLDSSPVGEEGSPGGYNRGSTAYPGMQTRTVMVNHHEVITDSEGYLVNLDRKTLEGAPTTDAFDTPLWADEAWNRKVYDYYKQPPFWGV